MPKFFTIALTALLLLNASITQAKPTKSNCASISKAQQNQVHSGTSKATLDRVLGSSCQLSGYGNGLSAYGYNLSYDSKNWLVIVYQNGKVQKSGVLAVGMGLREG